MSTKRSGATTFLSFWPHRGYGPRGRPRCRYCGQETPPGTDGWCTPACRARALHEFSLANDPAYQRREVFKRDHGTCAACGRDTLQLRRRLQAADQAEKRLLYHALLQEGYDRHRLDRLLLWEMDHIVPVVEGGGGTGLQNLQTLCIPCHKQKTAALLRQRRRAQQGLRDLFDDQR